MDVAYDHTFTDDVTANDDNGKGKGKALAAGEHEESLNEELQQAYKAISNSPWGARLGAFVGTVKKQGESYYDAARKEYPVVAEQAVKGFGDLRTNIVARTRAVSLSQSQPQTDVEKKEQEQEEEESLLAKIKKGASQRIAEIEAVEARADEYLAKFGSSIGGFLRDAITIAPPEQLEKGEVVFEAKTGAEKKQIFTTRLDAQLHMLHTNMELFKTDPKVESFRSFEKAFLADEQTERIAADLERYPELRTTMEKLVPDEVEYQKFWIRYYFLRNELDLEEKKRKDLLKGASIEEEEVGWDEDDDDDEEDEEEDGDEDDEDGDDDDGDDESATDKKVASTATTTTAVPHKTPAPKASTDTLQPTNKPKTSSSTDRASQPDSEASYDVVSSAPSHAAGSPPKTKTRDTDSSDEEADWE